jgi:hypothetical protein
MPSSVCATGHDRARRKPVRVIWRLPDAMLDPRLSYRRSEIGQQTQVVVPRVGARPLFLRKDLFQ